MKDETKTKDELLEELEQLRRQVTKLKKSDHERKQAEELRQSEEKYRLLADNSIDVIWQTDLKLVFTYVSPSIKMFLGYTVDEWVGSKLSQHASTKEFFNIARKALYAIKHYKKFKQLTFDAVMLRKDGTEIPVEITGKLLLNKKGLPIGLQGTTRNITERKKAEETEKEHHNNIELLSETAMRFIEFPQDRDIYTYIGEQLRELTGKDSYIVVNSVDIETSTSTIRAVLGLGKFADKITKLLGKQPVGMTFAVKDINQHYTDGKMHLYEEGIYGLLLKTIPKRLCDPMEKLLSIEKTYTLDLAKQGRFFGSVIIFLKEGAVLANKEIIETFTNQAAIVLQRRQAVEALSEANNIINRSPAVAFLWRNEEGWPVEFVTENVEHLTGYSSQEFANRKVSYIEIIHSDDIGRVTKEVASHSEKEGLQTFTHEPYRIITKSGDIKWIHDTTYIRRDTRGIITHYEGIVCDITKRKQAEERVIHLSLVLRSIRNVNQLITKEKDRDKLLQGTCDNLTENRGYHDAWIVLLDEEGKFLAHAESGMGESFLPMAEQLKRGELAPCWQRALKQPEVVIIEDPVATCTDCPLSGSYAGRGAVTLRLEYGKKIYGLLSVSVPVALATDVEELGLFHEVTSDIAFALHNIEMEEKRKQAEEELKLRVEMLDQARDVIVLHDLDGNFIYANEATLEQRGYTQEEFLKKNVRDIVVEPDTGRIEKWWQEIREKGYRHSEFDIRRKDGALVPMDAMSTLIKYRGKEYILSSTRDITERKQAEEEKAQLEQQFSQMQRLESVGRLAGGVAHDLNNMLTPILGFGELLLENSAGDEEHREQLEEIVKAGRRARDLVRQLLAFSRKQNLEFKNIDLNTLLKDFEKLLRSTVREDIAIRLIPATSLPLIRGDVGQLEQVIMNLVVNAQDAMPDGGELTIETTLVELDESYAAEHVSVIPGLHVMLAVSDTGCGMELKISEHIFEPFFTTKDKEKGTGLGLSTVYGIVKQHGGNIWVYSEPGKGTTFKVYLPVPRETPIAQETEEKTYTASRGYETILLAEDDEIVRKLAMTVLEQSGYTVLTAKNGIDALQVLKMYDGPVHMLLTDVVMPEMNGKELFNLAVEKLPKLKVLYMSGYTSNVIAHSGVLDEGIAFIQKPFAVQDLAAKVREVLD